MGRNNGIARFFQTRGARAASLLAVLFLAAAGVWYAVETYIIDVDRYRPRVIEQLERYTGLKASVAALDLDILPWPRVDVLGAALEQGDTRATVRTIHIEPRLSALLRGRIEINEIHAIGLLLELPEDLGQLRDVNDTIRRSIREAQRIPSNRRVIVDRIAAYNAAVSWRGDTRYAALDVVVEDTTNDRVTVSVRGGVPGLGEGAALESSVYVYPYATPRVTGQAHLSGVELARLIAQPDVPNAVASLVASITVPDATQAEVGLAGAVKSDTPLAGEFSGEARYDAGTVTIADLAWRGQGLKWSGAITRTARGDITAQVDEATADAGGLASLLALAPLEAFDISTAPDATARAEAVILRRLPGHPVQFESGAATFSGLTLTNSGDAPVAEDISGRIRVAEGELLIDDVTGQGFSLKGTVKPADAPGQYAVLLSGQADLAKTHVDRLLAGHAVQNLRGSLIVDSLGATTTRGGGVPADLRVEGRLVDGQFAVATDRFNTVFTGCTADFSTTHAVIQGRISGSSPEVGAVRLESRYETADRGLSGQANLDMGNVVGAFLRPQHRERYAPILDAYGVGDYGFTANVPVAGEKSCTIAIDARQAPDLHVTGVFERNGGWKLDAVDLKALVPAEAVAAVLPGAAVAAGDLPVTLTKAAGQDGFAATMDLTGAAVEIGDTIEKESGLPGEVRVTGDTGDIWAARRVDVALLGETLEAVFVEDGVELPPFRIALAPLSAVLPEGARMDGHVAGTYQAHPPKLDVRLESAALYFAPDTGFDSLDGTIEYSGAGLEVRDLAMRGANSSAVLDASVGSDGWKGTCSGEKLDINALEDLVRAINDLRQAATAEQVAAQPATGSRTGQLAVNFGAAYYRRARLDNLAFTAVQDTAGFHLRDLAFASDPGTCTGRIDVLPGAEGAAQTLDAALKLDGFNAHVLDDLLFAEPRGLKGTVSGPVTGVFPLTAAKDAVARANGSAQLVGRNGTFGKMGFATKLLSALRATEILQLRLPALKDEGLVYATCQMNLTMKDGVLLIEQGDIKSAVYSIAAKGTMDFARETTDVGIRVDLLEPVTKLVGKVPIVGSTVKTAVSPANLRLRATGSPYDVKIVPDPASRIESITGILGGPSAATPQQPAPEENGAAAAPKSEPPLEPEGEEPVKSLESEAADVLKKRLEKPLERILGR